ncbi:MAG: lipoate--protein ligase family protein [Solirubrobacteraceae bacterium]
MTVLRTGQTSDPAADMRLTRSLLEAVAARRTGPTARVFRPGPTAAFGRLDVLRPGFERAAALARARGYTPLTRHAGGHAAVYDPGCVIVELLRPEETAIGGLEARFRALADLIVAALDELGVALELGELPGEFCPGRFSLHLPSGGPKVVGIAQRVIRGGSLTTAVVSVAASGVLSSLVAEIYAALELALDPRTIGAIAGRHPEITPEQVADAIAERIPLELNRAR